jgi:membrane protease YdiL (CAAX protease family)
VTPTEQTQQQKNLGVILRVGVFVLIAVLGYFIFPTIMRGVGVPPFVMATLSTFATAAIANAIVLRIYERALLADIGMGWTTASRRNLAFGVLGGVGAAIVVLVGPVLFRVADLEPTGPNHHVEWPSLIFVSILLLFGAVGEEMLFRGYAFQVMVKAIGPFATILPISMLFGLLHAANLNFTIVALINTALWGVVLGYAFIQSGDLWLPIGLHFGWNWTLPLFGVNLSGFTMGVTGYSMHWKIGGLWSGGEYGPEGGLLTTAIVIALFFYLHKVPIQHQEAFLLQDRNEP